ncbi:MAG TPA: patatin-like protein, partial [Ornithinibacter sp.]|nr:patatin-like protein [Ornithinibacter sp.]
MVVQPGPHGLGEHDQSGVPPEEIRFGVVMNGGVSLAVWMGGVALELDRLVKAGGGSGPYADLLRLTGCTARVDVVSGTSAGGVNGAALALAQVNRFADLASLRDVWVEQGRIEALLRQPFRGAPSSLLKGDDHFLPQLNAAMSRLAEPLDPVPASVAPMDLTMATTVLGGNQEVTVDALGQRLPQTVHAARFRWKRPADATEDTDPFGTRNIGGTAAQLALAARASSSFPVAFEPTFVPVPAPDVPVTDTTGLRPSMAGVVEEWGDTLPPRDRSRFAVDGGVLANTPTRAAVEAIERMPADGPVRRVMLLVYPHAPAPGPDPADVMGEPPTLAGTMAGVLGALSAQGSRTFVDELEDHNVRAASRRG